MTEEIQGTEPTLEQYLRAHQGGVEQLTDEERNGLKEGTIARLAEALGFAPPKTRPELRGKGRGAGRTTRLLFEALYEVALGRPVHIASANPNNGAAQFLARELRHWCERLGYSGGLVKCLGTSADRTFETRCLGLDRRHVFIDAPENPCTLAEALAALRLRQLVDDALARVQVGESVVISRTGADDFRIGIVRPGATADPAFEAVKP